MGGSGDTFISTAPGYPETGLTGMLRQSFAILGGHLGWDDSLDPQARKIYRHDGRFAAGNLAWDR